jgi:hypothetical protein
MVLIHEISTRGRGMVLLCDDDGGIEFGVRGQEHKLEGECQELNGICV